MDETTASLSCELGIPEIFMPKSPSSRIIGSRQPASTRPNAFCRARMQDTGGVSQRQSYLDLHAPSEYVPETESSAGYKVTELDAAPVENHEHCLRMVKELEEENKSLLSHIQKLEGEKSGLLREQQRLQQQISEALNSHAQTYSLQGLMQEMLGSLTNWQQQVSGFNTLGNDRMLSVNPGDTFWTSHQGELESFDNAGSDSGNFLAIGSC